MAEFEITTDNLDNLEDIMSVLCSTCKYKHRESDTGAYDCFVGLDPMSEKCPFSEDALLEVDALLENFASTCSAVLERLSS